MKKFNDGKAPLVNLEATHENALKVIDIKNLIEYVYKPVV